MPNPQETFINSNGYLQYKENQGKGSQLVHRRIAFAEIYLPNLKVYPYDFEEYEIHHKNKDKLDNRPDNLELKLPADHYYTHFTKDHKRIKDAQLDTFFVKKASPQLVTKDQTNLVVFTIKDKPRGTSKQEIINETSVLPLIIAPKREEENKISILEKIFEFLKKIFNL